MELKRIQNMSEYMRMKEDQKLAKIAEEEMLTRIELENQQNELLKEENEHVDVIENDDNKLENDITDNSVNVTDVAVVEFDHLTVIPELISQDASQSESEIRNDTSV
jgi:hypothetical protein